MCQNPDGLVCCNGVYLHVQVDGVIAIVQSLTQGGDKSVRRFHVWNVDQELDVAGSMDTVYQPALFVDQLRVVSASVLVASSCDTHLMNMLVPMEVGSPEGSDVPHPDKARHGSAAFILSNRDCAMLTGGPVWLWSQWSFQTVELVDHHLVIFVAILVA